MTAWCECALCTRERSAASMLGHPSPRDLIERLSPEDWRDIANGREDEARVERVARGARA